MRPTLPFYSASCVLRYARFVMWYTLDRIRFNRLHRFCVLGLRYKNSIPIPYIISYKLVRCVFLYSNDVYVFWLPRDLVLPGFSHVVATAKSVTFSVYWCFCICVFTYFAYWCVRICRDYILCYHGHPAPSVICPPLDAHIFISVGERVAVYLVLSTTALHLHFITDVLLPSAAASRNNQFEGGVTLLI